MAPRDRAPGAEYVAAGRDLALVRIHAQADELLVFAGGRVHSFEPLPGAPGDAHTGFPVPLDLVRGADAEFRAVTDGAEVVLDRPEDAEVSRLRAELEREREARAVAEHELEQRATANAWLERESGGIRQRAEQAEADAAAARAAEKAAREAAERSAAAEREATD